MSCADASAGDRHLVALIDLGDTLCECTPALRVGSPLSLCTWSRAAGR